MQYGSVMRSSIKPYLSYDVKLAFQGLKSKKGLKPSLVVAVKRAEEILYQRSCTPWVKEDYDAIHVGPVQDTAKPRPVDMSVAISSDDDEHVEESEENESDDDFQAAPSKKARPSSRRAVSTKVEPMTPPSKRTRPTRATAAVVKEEVPPQLKPASRRGKPSPSPAKVELRQSPHPTRASARHKLVIPDEVEEVIDELPVAATTKPSAAATDKHARLQGDHVTESPDNVIDDVAMKSDDESAGVEEEDEGGDGLGALTDEQIAFLEQKLAKEKAKREKLRQGTAEPAASDQVNIQADIAPEKTKIPRRDVKPPSKGGPSDMSYSRDTKRNQVKAEARTPRDEDEHRHAARVREAFALLKHPYVKPDFDKWINMSEAEKKADLELQKRHKRAEKLLEDELKASEARNRLRPPAKRPSNNYDEWESDQPKPAAPRDKPPAKPNTPHSSERSRSPPRTKKRAKAAYPPAVAPHRQGDKKLPPLPPPAAQERDAVKREEAAVRPSLKREANDAAEPPHQPRKKPTPPTPKPPPERREDVASRIQMVDVSTPLEVQQSPLSLIWQRTNTSFRCHTDLVWDNTVFKDPVQPSGYSLDMAAAGLDAAPPVRGKRQVRSVQQSQIRHKLMANNLDPHTMVECIQYANDGKSQAESKTLVQPYDVRVHPDAMFVCDLHAHLAICEIIGFLGGRFDDATNTVFIHAAFPCRSLLIEGDDGSTDVEMDPESELDLRELIRKSHLDVVGWYHSHPAFAPDPSVRDIENQSNYQTLFETSMDKKQQKPFVGLIVGTYDPKRTVPAGLFRFFHVRGEKGGTGQRGPIVYLPYELNATTRQYNVKSSSSIRDVNPPTIVHVEPETSAEGIVEEMLLALVDAVSRDECKQGAAGHQGPVTTSDIDDQDEVVVWSVEEQRQFQRAYVRGDPVDSMVIPSKSSDAIADFFDEFTRGTTRTGGELRGRVLSFSPLRVAIHRPPQLHAADASRDRLRTKYGRGVLDCVEQVLQLIDYYRTFDRRVNLKDPWFKKMNKLDKIRQSLREYAKDLDLPHGSHQAFVEDIVQYLDLSWS
ncbi:hypothetical protein DYB37_001358 [Aphanomyces astaci]|uniref:MPN domain-containing protein n=1 Tax=Aphanomyces astaci TaxID=112090 RepID=A0A3R6YB00_APHAT|nr:hypothetical protein DYB37_001358 [Aphanomyces astaci]